jgi:hypothetical protein
VAVPVIATVLVFCTVNVASAELPTVTFPKFVDAPGETLKSAFATPLADVEQPPSLPTASTAEMRTK